jgi:hypothetical protein
MVVGALIAGYGVLLLPASALGGAWIVAVGASAFLSGLFALPWTGPRLGIGARSRRRLSLSFAALSVFLLVAFVVINYAGFESGGSESLQA